jgi:hypothetical protein
MNRKTPSNTDSPVASGSYQKATTVRLGAEMGTSETIVLGRTVGSSKLSGSVTVRMVPSGRAKKVKAETA